jgi:lysophospholipase L1-like esterase
MTSKFAVQDGETFVFVGDSITDCGRRDAQAPYGIGYAKITIDLITARHPERRIRFFNEGIGGNTVLDLRNRWHDDVLRHKPDWLSIKIGINDLHRRFNPNAEQIPPDRYETLYREILDRTRAQTKAKIVLIEPFYISTDAKSGSFRSQVLGLLPEYIARVRKLSKEYGTRLVRTHDAFQEQLGYRPADRFCPEPVHPFPSGHAVIAWELLKALGW